MWCRCFSDMWISNPSCLYLQVRLLYLLILCSVLTCQCTIQLQIINFNNLKRQSCFSPFVDVYRIQLTCMETHNIPFSKAVGYIQMHTSCSPLPISTSCAACPPVSQQVCDKVLCGSKLLNRKQMFLKMLIRGRARQGGTHL